MKLNFETLDVQVGTKGKPFRNISVERVSNNWLYVFKYIDDGTLFALEIDIYGKIVELTKDYGFKRLSNKVE